MTASRSSGSSGATSPWPAMKPSNDGASAPCAVEADQVPELRALGAHLRDHRLEARIVEEPGGLALVDDVGVLVRRRERGEADPDAASACRADPGLEGAAAVGAEDRHPVARHETSCDQRVRGAVAAFGHLAIADLAGPVDETGAVRVVPVAALEVVDQPHAAPPGSPLGCPSARSARRPALRGIDSDFKQVFARHRAARPPQSERMTPCFRCPSRS